LRGHGSTEARTTGRRSARIAGFTAAENDPGAIGELFETPNATTYARGHAFSDRGYVMKWWGQYAAPHEYLVSAAARYQDGQPFSRVLVVPDLSQGPEAISAYRRGRTRFTFTFSLDARVQKSFRIGRAVVTGALTLFNALNTGEEVEENVVTSALFRTPMSIQPPRTAHLASASNSEAPAANGSIIARSIGGGNDKHATSDIRTGFCRSDRGDHARTRASRQRRLRRQNHGIQGGHRHGIPVGQPARVD
jgi:hypothetical protein